MFLISPLVRPSEPPSVKIVSLPGFAVELAPATYVSSSMLLLIIVSINYSMPSSLRTLHLTYMQFMLSQNYLISSSET